MGETIALPAPMAYVACRRGVAWGVVLGCWPCAAVEVFMA